MQYPCVQTQEQHQPTNNRRNIIIKNCTPFTVWISEITKIQIDNAKDIFIVMPMYNLIAYSNNYSQTTGSLWQYCSEEPFLDAKGTVANFPGGNNSASCKFKKKKKKKKEKKVGRTKNNGTNNVKIMVPLKHLSYFWRTLDVPLIN